MTGLMLPLALARLPGTAAAEEPAPPAVPTRAVLSIAPPRDPAAADLDLEQIQQRFGPAVVKISAFGGTRVRNLAELRAALKKISDDYDAWTRSPDYREDKARYDPRHYAPFAYHVWDNELLQMVRKETAMPADKARAAGRSLDFAPAAGNGGAEKATPR
jgi:hypothetical protein